MFGHRAAYQTCMTLRFSHIMGAKEKIMLPIDSASLKTYKITIYLYFSDDYSQKI